MLALIHIKIKRSSDQIELDPDRVARAELVFFIRPKLLDALSPVVELSVFSVEHPHLRSVRER